MLQPSMPSRCHARVLAFTFILFWLASSHCSDAKIFTRCQLSKELIRYSFPRSNIVSWVCVLENESGRMTNKVTVHSNGTSYGLFQLNSSEWCKKGRKGGLCTMKCEGALTRTPKVSNHVRHIHSPQDSKQAIIIWKMNFSTATGFYFRGRIGSDVTNLLNEDLSDDVRCAKRMFDKMGFLGWPSWKSRCKGKPMPDISRCP